MQKYSKGIKWKKVMKFILSVFGLIICTVIIFIVSEKHPISALREENVFWLFSASAQTVATFVAFIIAGYTLYYSMMSELESKEDSLKEIINEEKNVVFGMLKTLAIITCISIGMNLYVLLKNGDLFWYRSTIIYLALFSTVSVIGLGTWTVIYMIDPNRKVKIANKIVEADTEFDQKGLLTEEQAFFETFVRTERKMRKLYYSMVSINSLDLRFVNTINDVSYRNVVEDLLRNEMISKEEYIGLMGIYKYRNLLFHGEIEKASIKMVKRVQWAEQLIDELFNKYSVDAQLEKVE